MNADGDKKLTKLFEPINIGHMEVKNRIAFAPTGMGTAGAGGSITDQSICHYTARAKGGAGLIIIEHSLCTLRHWRSGVPIISFHTANWMVLMKDLADAVHHYGAKVVVQLSLGLGRQTSPKVTGTELVAPSPVPFFVPEESAPRGLRHFEGMTGATPRALTTEEVLELEEDFVSATMRIKRAGFDGIEIHGAHGYLLADFISPLANKREDVYGGSFEKRLTLPLNLIRKTREKAGPKFVLGFRISGDEHVEGGLTIQDNLKLLPTLAKEGLDYIHLSSGRQEAFKNLFPEKEGIILPEAEAIKKVVDIPVICPNFHDPEFAESVVQENRVDVISLSRGLLADPELPKKAKEGRLDDIRLCIACNTCMQSIFRKGRIECLVNPSLGREKEMEVQPAKLLKKIMVIGGGPGGLNAARVAASRGHDVSLYEKQSSLGGQLILSSSSFYKKEMLNLIDFLKIQISKSSVKCYLNSEATLDSIKEMNPDVVIIATGSTPILPPVDGINLPLVVTVPEIFNGVKPEVENIVIIGGGATGCEVALDFSEKGYSVTIVEQLSKIGEQIEAITKKIIFKKLKENNVKILTSHHLVKVSATGALVIDNDGNEQFLEAESIIIAVGNNPDNTLFNQVKKLGIEVYQIGDCLEVRSAKEAIYEGASIGRSI